MLVRHQPRLVVLQLLQDRDQRLAGRQPHPQRQRVDEQPHHALDAGNLRRPTRHRDAEHHVVAAGQPPQQDRPRRLHEGVEGQPLRARLPGQRRGQRLTQRQRDLLGRDRHSFAIRRADMRALLQPRQGVLPGRGRGGAVLPGEPRQVLAVGRRPRQGGGIPLVRIEREQLLHQHRRRPAVHQDVVVGQHQPMLVGRKPDQREADERR